MQRRGFLGLAAGGMTWGQAPALIPVPLPAAAKIRSAVMLRMLSGTFEQRVKTAALAGLQGVGLTGESAKWSDAEALRAWRFVDSFGMRVEIVTERAGLERALQLAKMMNVEYVLMPGAEADKAEVRLVVDARVAGFDQSGLDSAALVLVNDAPEQQVVYRTLAKGGYHYTVALDYVLQGDAVVSLKKTVDGFRAVVNERPTEGSFV